MKTPNTFPVMEKKTFAPQATGGYKHRIIYNSMVVASDH